MSGVGALLASVLTADVRPAGTGTAEDGSAAFSNVLKGVADEARAGGPTAPRAAPPQGAAPALKPAKAALGLVPDDEAGKGDGKTAKAPAPDDGAPPAPPARRIRTA